MSQADRNTKAAFSALTAIWRGWRKTCPNCGKAPLYRKYLKQVDACVVCAAPLGQIRADDLPPYLTIMVVGHIIVPSIVMAEKHFAPPTWLHSITWLPLSLALMLWFLPRLKGCAIGVMCKLRLKGEERQGINNSDWQKQ